MNDRRVYFTRREEENQKVLLVLTGNVTCQLKIYFIQMSETTRVIHFVPHQVKHDHIDRIGILTEDGS